MIKVFIAKNWRYALIALTLNPSPKGRGTFHPVNPVHPVRTFFDRINRMNRIEKENLA